MRTVALLSFWILFSFLHALRAEENTPNRFKGSDSGRIAAAIAEAPRFGGLVKIPPRVPDEEADAEFSKFAGILSAALSHHHLLGFEIAQLAFHHLH